MLRSATVATFLLAASACATAPFVPARDQPCRFISASAIAEVIGVDEDNLAPREELDPTNENLCRYVDPVSGDQVVMLSVVADETTADEADARTSLIGGDLSSRVIPIAGPLGAPVKTTTIERCREACVTSVLFSFPPYFFIVHLTNDYGDADDARRIAELVLHALSP
jgi:hypothetical protein